MKYIRISVIIEIKLCLFKGEKIVRRYVFIKSLYRFIDYYFLNVGVLFNFIDNVLWLDRIGFFFLFRYD